MRKIDGKRHPLGDRAGKRLPSGAGGKSGSGCLSVATAGAVLLALLTQAARRPAVPPSRRAGELST